MYRSIAKRLVPLLAILAGVGYYAWATDGSSGVESSGRLRSVVMTGICLAVLYLGFAFLALAWHAVAGKDSASAAKPRK